MSSLSIDDLDVHPNIAAAARKCGFTNPGMLLEASLRDLKIKTGLKEADIQRLVTAAAQLMCPPYVPVWDLYNDKKQENLQIRFGCETLDTVLSGGIPCGKVTEIAGESGSGKTQLCLLLALQAQISKEEGGISKCVAYLCTESPFPVARLNQLVSFRKSQISYNKKQFSDNIFVHHLPDMDNLVDCIRYQLPHFTRKHNIGAVIIDSVAAVFRAAEETQEIKSKMVQQLGVLLRQLACKQHVAIIAVNQVSACMTESLYGLSDNITPALGLSWANLVTTRIMLSKSAYCVPSKQREKNDDDLPHGLRVRLLELVFCPWLARRTVSFVIKETGIEDIHPNAGDLYLSSGL